MSQGIKHHSTPIALVILMTGLAAPSWAQTDPGAPEPPAVAPPISPQPGAQALDGVEDPQPVPPTDAERLDTLFKELAEPGRPDWEQVQTEIVRIWSRSGSESMDLLLRRGNEASAAQDYILALDHFSALIEHAPDFAEGWNARATTYFELGEYSLSMSDIQHVLALNPRHFGALTGLAFMLEDLGEPDLALDALKSVRELNPNNPKINDAIKRLERATGEAEL